LIKVEDVLDQGVSVRGVARTPVTAVACPECGQLSERMHAYHQRRLADLPVDGRPVTVDLRVRRVVCEAAVRVSSVLGGAGRDLQGGVRAGQVDAIVPLTWTGGTSRLA
jgi:transposase